jgi:glucose-1-phosphate cytidylyltransferase
METIQTIILCGGIGTRLKEETEFRPKPMVEIGGKPILWHIMKIYEHYGFNNFIFALGYKGNYIKDFFIQQDLYISNFTLNTRTGEKQLHDRSEEDDFRITFVDTGKETLTGERVLKLKNYITSDTFMVTYGDGVSDVNIEKLINFHKKQNTIATITGVNPSSRFGLININEQNLVTGFKQKPKLHDYVNGGFMIFKKEFFNYLKKGDMIEDAFLRLVQDKQISLFEHPGFWFCIDTIRDLEEANRLWNENKPWGIWLKNNNLYDKQKNICNRGHRTCRQPHSGKIVKIK